MKNIEYAMHLLTTELRKDPEYYYAWQSGIAMAFYDEYRRTYKDKPSESEHDDYKEVHAVANRAAKEFLDMLIRQK